MGMTGCHARSRSKLEIQVWVARRLQRLIWLGMLPHLSARRWTAFHCLSTASLKWDMPMSKVHTMMKIDIEYHDTSNTVS